jgi:hypothetical protein
MLNNRFSFASGRTLQLAVFLIASLFALSACNTNDPTIGVTSAEAEQASPASNAAANSAVRLSSQADVAKASAKLYVAPIVGATVAAITPLSRRIAATAPANGIALVGSADPSQNFIIKGYFSAFPEGGATTLVFVWDVFDTKGIRLHRIQGQENVPGTSAGDPWSIVPPTVMERVADRFIADFNTWRGAQNVAPAASPAAPAANTAPAPEPAPTTTAPPPAPTTPAPSPAPAGG